MSSPQVDAALSQLAPRRWRELGTAAADFLAAADPATPAGRQLARDFDAGQLPAEFSKQAEAGRRQLYVRALAERLGAGGEAAAAAVVGCTSRAELRTVFEALGCRYGAAMHLEIGADLCAGRLNPARAASAARRALAFAPGPRELVRFRLKQAAASLALARAFEGAIYNHVVGQMKDAVAVRTWKDPLFLATYSAIAATVLMFLDVDSAIVRRHGDRVRRAALAGEISPAALAAASEAELCPEAFAAERARLALRSSQKMRERSSQLFKCPNCRARNCTYREVQTRALDEPATIYCSCQQCGQDFIGH